MTVRAYIVFVCKHPLSPVQPATLSAMGSEYWLEAWAMLFGWEGNRRSGIAVAMRQTPAGFVISERKISAQLILVCGLELAYL